MGTARMQLASAILVGTELDGQNALAPTIGLILGIVRIGIGSATQVRLVQTAQFTRAPTSAPIMADA